jgi:hypothetical protein
MAYVVISGLEITFLIPIPDFCFTPKLMFRVSLDPSAIRSLNFRNNSKDLIIYSPSDGSQLI